MNKEWTEYHARNIIYTSLPTYLPIPPTYQTHCVQVGKGKVQVPWTGILTSLPLLGTLLTDMANTWGIITISSYGPSYLKVGIILPLFLSLYNLRSELINKKQNFDNLFKSVFLLNLYGFSAQIHQVFRSYICMSLICRVKDSDEVVPDSYPTLDKKNIYLRY